MKRCDCVRCKNFAPCESATGFCDRFEPTYQTNADRIRAMSDEELAEFLHSQVQARCSNGDCIGADTCYYHADWNGECGDTCEQAVLRWLQSELEG